MAKAPFDALFALLLAEDAPAHVAAHHAALEHALSARVLPEALTRLETHKVLPLLAHQLTRAGRIATIDGDARARLELAQRKVRELNQVLFVSASLALKLAQEAECAPLVLKGLLLADSYYPDPSTRPMGDFDLVAPPGQFERLQRALERAGFTPVMDHVEQEHAVAFANRMGVSCDVHAYLESYPQLDWAAWTRHSKLQRVHGVSLRTLEPNLMLAHAIDHLYGHARETGLVLLWLIDIALMLRRHAAEFDLGMLRALLGRPAMWVFLLRVLGLLEHHGVALPAALAPLRGPITKLPALSLAQVMRGRRTLPWGLPAPLGYLRLLATSLSLRDYAQHASRSRPHAIDVLLLPLDMLITRLAENALSRVIECDS
ncbi:MAG: nucleotidyltransferase family protein [Myxococcales bacterium]